MSRIQQECIPVGCVPAARRPYAGVCFLGGGGVSGPGGCLLWAGHVCSWGGMSVPGGVWSGGVSAPGGVLVQGGWYPSMH